jgi:hypothetical protein
MLVTRFLATVILYIIREYAGCSFHVRLITFFKKNNNNCALGDIISLNLSITTLLNSTILYLAKKKKKITILCKKVTYIYSASGIGQNFPNLDKFI